MTCGQQLVLVPTPFMGRFRQQAGGRGRLKAYLASNCVALQLSWQEGSRLRSPGSVTRWALAFFRQGAVAQEQGVSRRASPRPAIWNASKIETKPISTKSFLLAPLPRKWKSLSPSPPAVMAGTSAISVGEPHVRVRCVYVACTCARAVQLQPCLS